MTFQEFRMAHPLDFDALLFDIDGTLIVGGKPLPGANELLQELRRNNFPFAIVTNDANHSLEEKCAYACRSGVPFTPDEVVSSGGALTGFVQKENLQGKLFFIMGELGNPCYAENAGLRTTRDPRRFPECDGVIQGEGTYDWLDHMTAAVNYFRARPDAWYIVPNPDVFWPGPKGTLGVGAGGQAQFICRLLEHQGICKEPVYLGKPFEPIYENALTFLQRKYGLPDDFDRKRVLMLGDSLTSDVRGSNENGLTSALLLTGITSREQADRAEGIFRPDWCFESLR